jgi:hypothetical protein
VLTEGPALAAGNAELDRDPLSLDPEEVVRGLWEAACSKRRDGARVHEQHPRKRPDVRDVSLERIPGLLLFGDTHAPRRARREPALGPGAAAVDGDASLRFDFDFA